MLPVTHKTEIAQDAWPVREAQRKKTTNPDGALKWAMKTEAPGEHTADSSSSEPAQLGPPSLREEAGGL